MQVRAIRARIRRLEVLSQGLGLEAERIRTGLGPFLWVERRGYFDALGDTIAGLEKARVILAKATQRIAGEGAGQAERQVLKAGEHADQEPDRAPP
jgi:hypothetical protein